ncbi:MAG TPA: PQQ-dependent sugar dehydrogenase [Longimicrobiales bacterium]|nr:PQQ-dependent sugar dehydrogenase [Longimicrobiales bacterium]
MRIPALVAVMSAAVACSGVGDSPAPVVQTGAIRAVEVANGLSNPLFLTAPAGDTVRLFVVEQPGRIRIIRGGSLLPQPFLDVSSIIAAGGERGLLSMAFDPDYAATGLFWVNYTDRDGDTRVVRYRVAASPDVADPASATQVLHVAQPYSNHNGGLVMFGPDRMLYVGMGDGGSAGDPLGHGQNRATLLGALLRIDVKAGSPYAIPSDNPFRTPADGRPEIWAYGLRNPWRFAFDSATGLLFIADVGQNAWEEINVRPAAAPGLNYGWNVMEGAHCYRSLMCARDGLVEPVHEYGRGDGCSITGGFVYRGRRLQGVQGHYFYSDYCQGWLRSFRVQDGRAVDHREWPVGALGQVLSFGQDAAGELYVLSASGRVFRLDPQ